MKDQETTRVVVIGAGFAGLEVAKRLARADLPVTVIDRRNHHLFQPLLYQVATAALSPEDIATPIRKILGRFQSVDVVMDEVLGIDRTNRRVRLASGGTLRFSHLVAATGARDSYFGKKGWADHAPGLKALEDAVALRSRVLAAFERAEVTRNADERARLMTFVVVGGGPTGVEMAGAIAELARRTLRREFRAIRPENARIVLVEAAERVLGGFDADLAGYVQEKLKKRGVDIHLGAPVAEIGERHITFDGSTIESETIFWAAGVAASPIGALLESEMDRAGRVRVTSKLHLPDDTSVFVLGDLAHCLDDEGKPLPGLAQVARQQGEHLGRHLARHLVSGAPIPAFRYKSRGNTAIVGHNAAIFEGARFKLRGWRAWFLWVVVHVYLLVGFRNRVMVSLQWILRYITSERSARVILNPQRTNHPDPE